jgi:hypothetical protein
MTRMAGSIKGVTDFLGVKPNYSAQGSQTIADMAKEFATVTQGNALAANAGMKAQADIAAAQHYADAGVAAGAAAGQASMVGGIASGLGGLAGGFNKAGGGVTASSIGRSIGGTPYANAFTPGGSWPTF